MGWQSLLSTATIVARTRAYRRHPQRGQDLTRPQDARAQPRASTTWSNGAPAEKGDHHLKRNYGSDRTRPDGRQGPLSGADRVFAQVKIAGLANGSSPSRVGGVMAGCRENENHGADSERGLMAEAYDGSFNPRYGQTPTGTTTATSTSARTASTSAPILALRSRPGQSKAQATTRFFLPCSTITRTGSAIPSPYDGPLLALPSQARQHHARPSPRRGRGCRPMAYRPGESHDCNQAIASVPAALTPPLPYVRSAGSWVRPRPD
jgi:hypothetical protein